MTDPQRGPEPGAWAPQPSQYSAPPPGYGPPPPGWGPPPSPYGYAPPRPPTNTLAILALVFAFVFAPAGIVLGVVARKQIERTGEEGHGLATAGLWVSVVFTALFVLYIVFMIVMFATVFSQIPSTNYSY